ncbi:MAG: acyltransferase [Bacteroidetes bacterium]|nr:acyltransferase [Bacteroidota bacterium]
MSYRVFTPQDYPLPYIIEDVGEWPIAKLTTDVDAFTAAVQKSVVDKLMKRFEHDHNLKNELEKVLYQERIRLTQTPWKADPKDERQFWNNIKSRIVRLDAAQGDALTTEEDILNEIVNRYTHEIVGRFDKGAFKFAGNILPLFFGRILNAAPGKWFKTLSANAKTIHEKIPITGDVEHIRSLAKKGTIIVVPTHFSNMDSIMVGWVLNELGLPAFTYGAGLNLFSIKLLSYFMSNLGAYKVDRRKKNGVYLETLKTYSREAIERGAHSIFFPGGTRSRSGALERKLKLGLLGTAVEAQKNNFKKFHNDTAPRIYVVPLIINYHFVLEAESLINDYLKETGKEKFIRENDDYSTSFGMVKFIFKFLSASSSLAMSFGTPMDVLGNHVDADGDSYNHLGQKISLKNYFMNNGELTDNQQREEEYTKILGERIVNQYFKHNVVLTSHLVCFCAFELIRKKYRHGDIFTLLRTPAEDVRIEEKDLLAAIERVKEQLKEMNKNNEVLISLELRFTNDKVIEHGMNNINLYHSRSPLLRSGDGYYYSEDLKLLYYYHNRLEGYKLEKYV